MTTYWNLTRHERSLLSQESLEKYKEIECMQKGVIYEVPTPKFKDTHSYSHCAETLYRVGEVYFTHIKDAQAFIELNPRYVPNRCDDEDYLDDLDLPYVVLYCKAICPTKVYTEQRRQGIDHIIKENARIHDINEDEQIKYENLSRNKYNALVPLTEDHKYCVSLLDKSRCIINMANKYFSLTANKDQTLNNLLLLYTKAEIKEAYEFTDAPCPFFSLLELEPLSSNSENNECDPFEDIDW